MNTTTISYRDSLAYLHERMVREQKSFSHYAGGEPMRSVIAKRADNAATRFFAALSKVGGSELKNVPNGIPGSAGCWITLIGDKWHSLRCLKSV